jgi:hypothetical protein
VDVLGGYIRDRADRGNRRDVDQDRPLILASLCLPLAILIFLGAFIPFVGATTSGLVAVPSRRGRRLKRP